MSHAIIAQRHRDAYLQRFRNREPNHKQSVDEWIAHDLARGSKQTPDRELNIPIDGFVSLPPPPPPERRRFRGASGGDGVADPRKQSVFLSAAILDELRHEAQRTGLAMSTLMQHAWRIARERLRRMPLPGVEMLNG